jgi:hypothetical protein
MVSLTLRPLYHLERAVKKLCKYLVTIRYKIEECRLVVRTDVSEERVASIFRV